MAGKYDEMSFKQAFVAARKAKGAGKTFTWKGKSYTTNTKEDKKSGAPKKSLRPKPRPTPTKKSSPNKSGTDSRGRTKDMRMADIKKIMKEEYGDKPHLLDNLGSWIRNFRAKQGKQNKDPRK
jgi:hypothetical protein